MIARRTAARWLAAFAALVVGVWLAETVTGCSSSQVHTAALAADTIGRGSNAALDVAIQAFKDQQRAAWDAACGGTTPCSDPQAARAAVLAVRGRWAPAWAAWTLAEVAHSAWSDQLERCQAGAPDDSGPDAGTCGPQLAQLAATAIEHLGEVRCALIALGQADPFPGPLDCSGAPTGPESDGGL